ncbi:MAG: histidine kinase dimerization/phosphoacceptor domain -containing protein [Phaeospirillum sp.]|nr:histidine kinase dimerization/phosphoacceptor domain -containing protein [Phaeospirillum sp.]
MARLPRPRFLITVIVGLTLIGGVIGLVTSIWSDYDATLADWRADLGLSSRLVESHIRGLHAGTHASLLRIEDRLAERPLADLRGSEPDRDWLDMVLAGIPGGFSIGIHDDKSDQILSTDRREPFVHIAIDRESLSRSWTQPGRTVISARIVEQNKPEHFIVFSRALINRSGEVRGVAEILIRPEVFADFYTALQPPDQGSIFLVVRTDGTLIARHPLPDNPLFRFDTSKHPFTEFAKGSEGIYRAVSVVDKVDRLISFRHLPDLDLVVTAGMTMDMVFRDWTIRTQRGTTLFAGGMLLLLALTVMAGESLRHETRLLRSFEQKTTELTSALAEKDVLFQEVHHRVKNNLQVISSLLTMQSLHVADNTARETLKDALDRIHSMGLVHQTLYERNLASNVDLGIYFGRLAEALVSSYGSGKGGVTVHVDVTGTLDLDRAVPLGMLANEALTNALKHAFPDGRGGAITISLTRDESLWHFSIRDDGVGMPSQPGKGIGLSLIRALTRQLNGRSAISRDGGTVVIVTFPV